jgi:hypothetical protein
LVTPRTVIEKAKTIEQHDKSLWIGNVTTQVYDWSEFQKAASKIQTKIKKTQVPA